MLAEAGTPHQDAGQVSLVGTASLDWCREHLGVDGDRRRIRPNLVVSTTEPFVEESWGGARIRVGERRADGGRAHRAVPDGRHRPGGLAEQPGWLKALGRERDLCLGIYADVAAAGSVTVGDPVRRGRSMKDSRGD